jgi:hypothetical protein
MLISSNTLLINEIGVEPEIIRGTGFLIRDGVALAKKWRQIFTGVLVGCPGRSEGL